MSITDALAPHFASELARRSLLDFCDRVDPNWKQARHLTLMAARLEALERGEGKRRQMVACPPRHGKSELHVRKFIPWYLGRNPRSQVVVACYGDTLAEAHGRAIRQTMEDDRYPFATRIREDSRSAGRFETNDGSIVLCVGVGQGLTGRGFDLGVCDDLVKGPTEADSDASRATLEAWWQEVLMTRQMPGAKMVLCGTRWRDNDIMGTVLEASGSEWDLLRLPFEAEDGDPMGREAGELLWPERFTHADVPSVERGEISTRSFVALYQGRPEPAEGALFKKEWLEHFYDGQPPVSQRWGSNVKLQAIDTAVKTGVANDYSVIVTIESDGNFAYVIDVERKRVEFPDLCRWVVQSALRHGLTHGVHIEDAGPSGIALIQKLKTETGLPIIPVKVGANSKMARAEGVTAHFEGGRIRFPRHAEWYGPLVDEMLRFPVGKHDDQVDALVHAITASLAAIGRRNASSGIGRMRYRGGI